MPYELNSHSKGILINLKKVLSRAWLWRYAIRLYSAIGHFCVLFQVLIIKNINFSSIYLLFAQGFFQQVYLIIISLLSFTIQPETLTKKENEKTIARVLIFINYTPNRYFSVYKNYIFSRFSVVLFIINIFSLLSLL